MIRFVIEVYVFLIIVDAILSYIPSLRHNEIVRSLRKVTDLTQKPIRNALPHDLPFDPSPIIVILLLNLLKALW